MLSLLLRFFLTTYDDPMEILTQFKQTLIVAIYKGQFEFLSNRSRVYQINISLVVFLVGLNKLSCVLSGLKNKIYLPMIMLNLLNLRATFDLTKIHEEYLTSARRALKPILKKSIFEFGKFFSHKVAWVILPVRTIESLTCPRRSLPQL